MHSKVNSESNLLAGPCQNCSGLLYHGRVVEKAQPGGGGWNELFDVNKATRLALLSLHTALYSDRSLATTVRCSSAALIA